MSITLIGFCALLNSCTVQPQVLDLIESCDQACLAIYLDPKSSHMQTCIASCTQQFDQIPLTLSLTPTEPEAEVVE